MNLSGAWQLGAAHLLAALCLAGALFLLLRQPRPAPERRGPELHLVRDTDEQAADSELRRQLFQAGFDQPGAVRQFLYAKIGFGAAALAVAMILLRTVPALHGLDGTTQLALMLIAAVAGYFVPVIVIDKRRAAYLKRIELALPDALDFLLVCVEAGQSTDVAIMRVSEELRPVHPDLAARFLALTETLAAGADRQDAWLRMAHETGNDDLRQLASVILQSTAMGTPVAQTLRVFSADLRDRRIRKVEERANILPTKMTLGTMMFTVPPLLILLLAPAIYRIAMSF